MHFLTIFCEDLLRFRFLSTDLQSICTHGRHHLSNIPVEERRPILTVALSH